MIALEASLDRMGDISLQCQNLHPADVRACVIQVVKSSEEEKLPAGSRIYRTMSRDERGALAAAAGQQASKASEKESEHAEEQYSAALVYDSDAVVLQKIKSFLPRVPASDDASSSSTSSSSSSSSSISSSGGSSSSGSSNSASSSGSSDANASASAAQPGVARALQAELEVMDVEAQLAELF